MAKPLREILGEGWFKDRKREIGHSLPNTVRSGIAASVALGKYVQGKTEHNPQQAENAKNFMKRAISGKHQLPKFKDS